MHNLINDDPQGVEDDQLLSALRRKEPDAMEKIYRCYGSLLKSIIMQVLHDETEAQEVVQDVLMQIWERSDNYSKDKGRFSSWLITLARRRAIDRVRKDSAYRRATDRYEVACNQTSQTVEDMHPVERDVQREDLRQCLETHLEALPPNQREAVRLAFLESKTQREISAITGIPLGTIKTRIELGIRKLATSMAGTREDFM
ncbi:MAG: sigma-70 family RNA polymerase sigma factor [Chthoniobacterales bacterium]